MSARRARAVSLHRARAAGLAIAALLTGCVSQTRRPPAAPAPAPAPTGRLDWQAVPDAVPRLEPRSRYGNPPFYDVFGQRYYVLSSGADYLERGVASWYGPGFHKVRTSTGEPYDMFGMTAAHKTLPLPAYVRVTNLKNGRSVIVRVNDRGPFIDHRIIDLSYTAAAKLDMLREGTAFVEVRSIDPAAPRQAMPPLFASTVPATPIVNAAAVTLATATAAVPTPAAAAPPVPPSPAPSAAPADAAVPMATTAAATTPAAPVSEASAPALELAATSSGAALSSAAPTPTGGARAGLYIQAGAFANAANATRLLQRLKAGGYEDAFVREDMIAGRTLYRVRIGPVPDVPEFDRIVSALEQVGVRDAHLALD